MRTKAPRKVNPNRKKGGCKDFRPYSPMDTSGRKKMFNHCIILLKWATENRNAETSITIISEETGIPRMSVQWILKDYKERKQDSTLGRAARSQGYDVLVYKNWNNEEKDKYKMSINHIYINAYIKGLYF